MFRFEMLSMLETPTYRVSLLIEMASSIETWAGQVEHGIDINFLCFSFAYKIILEFFNFVGFY